MTDPEPVNVGNPPAPRRGRKTKLTRFLIEQAKALLEKGTPQEATASLIGISPATWFKWLQDAEKPGAQPLLAEFLEAVTRARARCEDKMIEIIMAAAEKDARHAEWFLERAHPQRWAQRRVLHLDPATVEAKEITLEDLRRMKEEQDAIQKRRNGRNGH